MIIRLTIFEAKEFVINSLGLPGTSSVEFGFPGTSLSSVSSHGSGNSTKSTARLLDNEGLAHYRAAASNGRQSAAAGRGMTGGG